MGSDVVNEIEIMGGGPYNWFDDTLQNKVIVRGSGVEVTSNDGTLVVNSELEISDFIFKSGDGSKVLI